MPFRSSRLRLYLTIGLAFIAGRLTEIGFVRRLHLDDIYYYTIAASNVSLVDTASFWPSYASTFSASDNNTTQSQWGFFHPFELELEEAELEAQEEWFEEEKDGQHHPVVSSNGDGQPKRRDEVPDHHENRRSAQHHHARSFQVTRGKTQPREDSTFFTIISSTRSGSDWVMNSLNRHESVCASGDFPTAALHPSTMPWIPNTSIEKGCTLAFIRESIAEITANVPGENKNDGGQAWTPPRCEPNYDASNDELKPHLERFCAFVKKLDGDFSNEVLTRVFVDAFVENDKSLTGCRCPESTTVRGLRVVNDWLGDKLPLEKTAATGSKVVRLTRGNFFERFMSMAIAQTSNHWTIRNEADKVAQLDAFKQHNYTVDVDWMLSQFQWMRGSDEDMDAWVYDYGGETLWVDYEQVRDDPGSTFSKVAAFLGVESDVATMQQRLKLDEAGSLSSYSGKALLDYIANREEVVEALGANGFGSFVGLTDYAEMQHIVFVDETFRTATTRKGLKVTVLNEGHTTITSSGSSARFGAAISALKTMSPDSLVVLSDGRGGAVNHHIRSMSAFYSEIAKIRATLAETTRRYPGAVMVSASTDCCSNALSHVQPGAFFHNNGKRNARSCKGAECELTGHDNADFWKTFMKELASKQSQSDAVYLDATFVAGTASDLLRLIEAIDIEASEDDRSVLTEYMYRNTDKIVLDYDHKMFGPRFEGVASKMDFTCAAKSDKQANFEKTASPLFLHSPRQHINNCHLKSNGNRFPAWEATGIAVKPILDHIDRAFVQDVSMSGIDRHFGKEFLYILDSKGIWATEGVRDRYRVKPTENFLALAHEELMHTSESSQRWSALQKSIQSTGFPYWGWYGDWKGCNYRNVGEESIPLFTTCATTACNHSFPTPSYMTTIDSQPDTAHWYNVFRRFDQDYPWESKIRKVVWRGGLSENDPTKVFDSQRWRLCKFVAAISDPAQKDMFDVGLTNIPNFLTDQIEIDPSIAGGIVPGIGSMNDFQKHAAVLDMDGNSWSSRFGTMLCYNSVAIKVEPAYADYFFYDLIPWKHYVPIKNDLSDLLENVAFVLDPANDDLVKEIIASANQWCAERLTKKGLAYDMLDTWESYIQLLDRADPNWTNAWTKTKEKLLSPSSNIPLLQLK